MASRPPSETLKLCLIIQITLRILGIGTTLAAAWLMFSNKETTVVFDIQVDATYSYSPAFKFFAFANIIASASSVFSLIVAFIMGKNKVDPIYYFYLFLHDLIISTLLMGGFAAAMAIGYLGKYGNTHTGWIGICDHFAKFCNRIIASLIVGFLGFAVYLILTLISAKKATKIQA